MMKIVSWIVLAVLCVAVAYLYWGQNEQKIVYVESNRLLSSYVGMQDAGKLYQQKVQVWKSNIDTLRSELQKEIEKYQKGKVSMPPKEAKLSEDLIATKRDQLMQYQKSIEEIATQEDQEMTKNVLDKVNGYIKKYGKEHGYNIIMAATETGNIVYAEDGLNITDQVLKGLNEEYNGK